ncbi:chemotaxis protein [Tistrella bauzanensis]|uniref:Chemotaxis protein n=1 Tax=Tistrella bauzanensis TaxID=657419 RepID=A0ABQ1J531_9PROT|nr:HAMP domain-containing methyl-accepting chemotaxis protein [Tistrella bauzanensis]GGB57611.1 chemotaxis protein [Tistrella bauzanensis]
MTYKSLSIRGRLAVSSILSAMMIIAAGAAGIFGFINSDAGLTEVTRVTAAVRQHMQGDMMHDALRGDVLMALRVGPEGTAGDKAELALSLREHADSFRAAMARLGEIGMPDEVQRLMAPTLIAVDRYIAAAESIVARAMVDHPAADAAFPAFMDSFSVLEADMEALGDQIEATSLTVATRAQQSNASLLTLLVAVVGGSTVLMLTISFVTGGAISRSINRMADAMTRLAAGDTAIDVAGRERRDEIGRMAQAVEVFRDTAITNARMAGQRAAEAAARDQRARDIEALCHGFDRDVAAMLDAVVAATAGMQDTAGRMRRIADDTAADAIRVGSVSEAAAGNVDRVAGTTEELAGSIAGISQDMARSTDMTTRAAQQAGQTNEQVRALADTARRVGAVVTLIAEIAEQTNLLALNATIEAARAGDAGKGFAVVAGEVKALATQTARATEDISRQVTAIQAETARAATAIEAISATIGEIDGITTSVASAVDRQGRATRDIAASVEQAATGSRQVAGGITQVTDAARQTGEAAAGLLSVAGDLARRSDALKARIDSFLGAVRTA